MCGNKTTYNSSVVYPCLPKLMGVRLCCETCVFLWWTERLIFAILGFHIEIHLCFALFFPPAFHVEKHRLWFSSWMRKGQSRCLTSTLLSQQCHVACSSCLPHKRSHKQPFADAASVPKLCYPQVLGMPLQCTVLCRSATNLMERGRAEDGDDAEEEQRSWSLSAPSAIKTILLHKHFVDSTPSCAHATVTAQQLRLDPVY